MADLSVSPKYLSVSNLKETLIVGLEEDFDPVLLTHSQFESSNEEVKLPSDHYDGSVPTIPSAFSPCGNWFACSSSKTLAVWKTGSWELNSKRSVHRSVSKIFFTPKSNSIIVADKSGDVYLHDVMNSSNEGVLLLGHVSMLLDVLVTPNEDFIISCDRDEKIRVSSFPNAYNIVSYCLGHEEFVTSLHILPTDSRYLLSSGGDGTFRVWDFKCGQEVFCYNLSSDVSTEPSSQCIISKVSLLTLDSSSTLVCSLIAGVCALWVHLMKKISDDSFICNLHHSVTTHSEPYLLKTLPSSASLCLLQLNCESPILHFTFTSGQFLTNNDKLPKSAQEAVRNHFKGLDLVSLHDKLINALCKKKHDNESEYFKRKQERLGAQINKKLAR